MNKSITEITTGRWFDFSPQWQAYISETLVLPGPRSRSGFLYNIDIWRNPYMVLAWRVDEIVGWAAYFPEHHQYHWSWVPEAHFFVAPAFRRKGIGGYLMRRLAKYMSRYRKDDRVLIRGWDNASKRFFRKMMPEVGRNINYQETP